MILGGIEHSDHTPAKAVPRSEAGSRNGWFAKGFAVLRRLRQRVSTKVGRLSLRRAIRASSPLRIIVGSGGAGEPGWIATDDDQLNLVKADQWESLFARASLDAILAEHVWEHLTPEEGVAAARLCYQYLRPGGYVRAAVPDGFHPDPVYIEHVKVGGSGPGANDHRVLYDHVTLSRMFKHAGFEVELVEYFDSDGLFHSTEWDVAKGKIYRSRRFDNRNDGNVCRYTSIIIDAHKP